MEGLLKEIVVKGKVWKYGHNIDTDVIIPGKYMSLKTLEEQMPHTMEGVDPSFAGKVKKGDVLVAGRNFGCGSSRDMAAMLLKACGVAAVIAEGFSRIFFRNAINQGLLVVECKGIHDGVEEGDLLEYHSSTGVVANLTRKKEFTTVALPEFLQAILTDGGAIEHFRKKNRTAASAQS
jgi:3-isopropylmalate/(R)-2-methylmalate dehydratase small subunit